MNSHPKRPGLLVVLLLLILIVLPPSQRVESTAAFQRVDRDYRMAESGELTLGPISDGVVYGSESESIFAVDIATGQFLWRFTATGSVLHVDVLDGELHAFVLDRENAEVVDVDPSNGLERWRLGDVPVTDLMKLLVTTNQLDLVVLDLWSDFGCFLVGIDASTGTIRWTQNFVLVPSPAGETIAAMVRVGPIVEGRVVAAGVQWGGNSSRGLVLTMDDRTGWPLWETYPDQLAYIVGNNEGVLFTLVADALGDDRYVRLTGLDLETGEGKWQTAFAAPVLEAESAGDLVAVQTTDESLFVINGITGETLWSRSADTPIGSIGLDGSRVFTVDLKDVLSAADAQSGEQLWQRDDLGDVTNVHAQAVPALVIVESALGLFALDPERGKTVWSVDLAGTPGEEITTTGPATIPISLSSQNGTSMLTASGPLGMFSNRTLPALGGEESVPTDINASGQISGYAETADHSNHAVVWNDDLPVDIGTLGGRESEAMAVNDMGQVVGWSETEMDDVHAFFWTAGLLMDLHPEEYAFSIAFDINAQWQIAGTGYDESGEAHALVWNAGQAGELPGLGGSISAAIAVNADGLIAGIATTAEGAACAVIWDGDVIIRLSTPEGSQSAALGINAHGDVTGFVEKSNGQRLAVVWINGEMRELATPPGAFAEGNDINDAGYVVGYIQAEIGQQRAVLWNLSVPEEFQVLGYYDSEAIAINDHLQIAGTTGRDNAVVWEVAESTIPPSAWFTSLE
jgi:probable HAF family extracellular repeat protein